MNVRVMQTIIFVGAVVVSFVAGRIFAARMNISPAAAVSSSSSSYYSDDMLISRSNDHHPRRPHDSLPEFLEDALRIGVSSGKVLKANIGSFTGYSDEEEVCKVKEESSFLDDDPEDFWMVHDEMLVQPAMLAHPNPKTIAIYYCCSSPSSSSSSTFSSTTSSDLTNLLIGQVRQVLRHSSSTVKSITIFTTAEDEETTTITTEDALVFDMLLLKDVKVNHVILDLDFNEKVVNEDGDGDDNAKVQVFDVAILNLGTAATTTTSTFDQEEKDTKTFEKACQFFSDRLDAEAGVLVTTLPSHTNIYARLRTIQTNLVEPGGFAKVADYQTAAAAAFGRQHSTTASNDYDYYYFAVAFKNITGYAHWHLNEAEWNLRIHQRMQRDDVDTPPAAAAPPPAPPPLFIFDSATMLTLAYPSRKTAWAFCEMEYGVEDCPNKELEYGLNPNNANVAWSELEVKQSTLGELAGRGVFTTVDAPKGTYLERKSSSSPVRASWTTLDIVFSLIRGNELFDRMGYALDYYFDGYGFYDEPFVRSS